MPNEEILKQFILDIDEVVGRHRELGAHVITGALLSRVVLLMQFEPETGLNLIRYAWEKLDEVNQNSPPGIE